MKNLTVALLVALVMTLTGRAEAYDDVQKTPSCQYCGMDREMFAHSRMVVTYDDGTATATCSLHCLAIDFALNIDKTPVKIEVADFGTKELVDAEKAAWVIGGNKPGVMSKVAKWAFANKADARLFTIENGGSLATFEQAIQAAYTDMYMDIKMIREKRKMKKMKGAHTHS